MNGLAGLAVTTAAMLLGSMVFFAAIVAPAVFSFLPEDQRPKYLSGVFPRYYLWGVIVGAAGAAVALAADMVAAVLIACVALAFLGVRQILVPRIEVEREGRAAGDPIATAHFARLHRISVIINMTQLIVLVAAIALLLVG